MSSFDHIPYTQKPISLKRQCFELQYIKKKYSLWMTLNSRQKEQWAENETSVPKFYDSG